MPPSRLVLVLTGTLCCFAVSASAAEKGKAAPTYFAYPAVEDSYGVIAPWYGGQNGQMDFRIRVAAETLKRYPWAEKPAACMAAPHFIFNGTWAIQPEGRISVNPNLSDWENGDIGQRSVSLICGMADYYRYTGDPAAIGIITLTADFVLDCCQTPAEHPWPRFMISCPTKGKAYHQANPHGFIQLDITAQVGSQLLRAYKLTGNRRYLDAAKHWADLLAEHCDFTPGHAPWPRYANPKDSTFRNKQTAGVSLILQLLDDLICFGYTGKDGQLLKARDAGEQYLRDVLLPEWTRDPTFGHFFWDWDNPVMTCSIPCYTVEYLMNRRKAFPNWKTDVRNILSLMFCRLSVDPASSGDAYSGAWAVPESSGCCGRSLQYPTMIMSSSLARYGIVADSQWAREVARRQCILMTYDARDSGVVIDGILGVPVVAGSWFHLAHPLPLRYALEAIGWRPDLFGPSRENHIVRSTSVVQTVCYGKGRIAYSTFDAQPGTEDVLRLAFEPASITADGQPLSRKTELVENGYAVQPLSGGDCLVTVRHDGRREMIVEGPDPQEEVGLQMASEKDAATTVAFEGSQVRLIGRAGPDGGRADVYLDGIKQLCGIDFWSPQSRDRQVVYYKNGLSQGKHTLRIVATAQKNPVSHGARINLDAAQWSAAQGVSGSGSGGGPSDAQRVIFGYTGRKDIVDSQHHAWRLAAEFTMRLGQNADLIPIAFRSEPRVKNVTGTSDPELYRYGIFGKDFTTNFTVDPKLTYSVRIKLCQTAEPSKPGELATTIDLQGKTVAKDVDIAATAGGLNKAVDLVFNNVRPEHGMIAVRFWHRFAGTASVQAIEILPGPSEPGAKPKQYEFPPGKNLLSNPGFEDGFEGTLAQASLHAWAGPFVGRRGWNLTFVTESQAAVYPETEYRKHPQSGLPKFHGGKEAMRTCAAHGDIHTRAFQEVSVDPQTTYRASVWVQGVSLGGKGFGTKPADSAGFIIEELDDAGNVLLRHPKVALTKAADFTELAQTFTTGEKTVKVRFVLDTVIGCRWDYGHVAYDDCSLVQQSPGSKAAQASPAHLELTGYGPYFYRYIHPPTFTCQPVPEAEKYLVQLTTPQGATVTATSREPAVNLTSVWAQVPTAIFNKWQFVALAGDGKELARSDQKTLYKAKGFSGEIPTPKQPLPQMAEGIMRFLLSDTGMRQSKTPDVPPYVWHSWITSDNKLCYISYPAHHHAIFISTFLNYRRWTTDETLKAECLRRAEALGQWNIAHSTPANAYYAFLPYATTEAGKLSGGADGAGVVQPSKSGAMGTAYLNLYHETQKQDYLDAAKRLGDTLVKTQTKDGSWPFRADLATGKAVNSYSTTVVFSMHFLHDLAKQTGDRAYRRAYQDALQWVMEGPVKTRRWEGSYEDCGNMKPFADPTWIDVHEFLTFILTNRDEFPNAAPLARSLLEYVEDTFVFFDPNDPYIRPKQHHPRVPCAGEQGFTSVPMDIHTAFYADMLMAIHRANPKPEYLAKAEAAFNAASYNQNVLNSDGRDITLSPELSDQPCHDPDKSSWYSCNFGTADKLISYLRQKSDSGPQ